MEQKPLPKNAKLAFKGIIYEVWQWEQEMFDGSKNPYERLKRPDTAAVIALVGDKIMLSEEEQPYKGAFLSLPGGRCEESEAAIDAAKRELLEETGYASDDIFLWKAFHPARTILWNDDYFIARDCKKVQEPNPEDGEHIKTRLISFEEFLMLSENEQFRHQSLKCQLLHMRLHPEEQAEFKKLLS